MKRERAMRRRGEQGGFALLMVFLIAASICIFLYMQLPRVAFEAVRDKEEMLIERGTQYQRAIQLFVRANNKYPSKIEDLEKFSGKRFLRRRYKDPMTGKDEWREVHVGPNGVLLDSVLQKNNANKGEKKTEQTFITEGPSMMPSANQGTTTLTTLAKRQRDSDRPGAPGSSPTSNSPYGAPPNPNDPNQPQTQSGYPQTSGGQYPPQGFQPNPTTDPNQQQAQNAPPPGVMAPATTPQVPGMQTPTTAGGGQGSAMEAIQRLLTTPRTGGLPGSSSTGQTIGGGIAGFASKAEMEGIKVYNGSSKYNEWEFIYDIKSELQKQMPTQMPNQNNPLNSPQRNSSTSGVK